MEYPKFPKLRIPTAYVLFVVVGIAVVPFSCLPEPQPLHISTHFDNKKFKLVETQARRRVLHDSTDHYAWYLLGGVATAAGEYDAAAYNIAKALEFGGNIPDYLCARSRLALVQKNYAAAKGYAVEAASHDFDCACARVYRAAAEVALGNLRTAHWIIDERRSIAHLDLRKIDWVEWYLTQARIYSSWNNYGACFDEAVNALCIDPDSQEAYALTSWAIRGEIDYVEKLQALNERALINSLDRTAVAEGSFVCGLVHLAAGNDSLGCSYLKQYVKDYRDYVDINGAYSYSPAYLDTVRLRLCRELY